ncbi:hypothetical protein BH10ACI4_BH10ACI4_19900 [soil metagenome]
MAANTPRQFRAVLEPLPGNLGWVIARVPFDVEAAWKTMVRLRVEVEIGGEIFRTSLFSDPNRGGHFILVNKKMQKAAAAKLGAQVDFTIRPDLEARTPSVPTELAKLLKPEKALSKWFSGLSESTRYEIAKWIEGVKSPESRQRRAEQMAERLLLTMEGEKLPPPILELAFREHPAARKGWQAMTLTQRRSHLMGIFYYKSPEARAKRVDKAVQNCLEQRDRI